MDEVMDWNMTTGAKAVVHAITEGRPGMRSVPHSERGLLDPLCRWNALIAGRSQLFYPDR